MSLSLSLSLSLLKQRAKIHRSRRTERVKKSFRCQKLRLFKGCLPNTPTPHNPLQVSSSRRNFIRAGFLYKLITTEGTSHLLSVCVWEGGRGGCWVCWNIVIRCSPMLLRPPLPTTHAHTSRRGNIFLICLQVYHSFLFLH